MKPIASWIFAALVAGGLAGAVAAADMASVIKDRQAHYKQIGKDAKAINDGLGSASPNMAAIAGYAREIDQLAPQIPSWFPTGSGPEAGVKTGALPAIWEKPADFTAAAAGLAAAAKKFDAVAAGGNAAATRAEFANLGKACKTCHDQFRKKGS